MSNQVDDGAWTGEIEAGVVQQWSAHRDSLAIVIREVMQNELPLERTMDTCERTRAALRSMDLGASFAAFVEHTAMLDTEILINFLARQPIDIEPLALAYLRFVAYTTLLELVGDTPVAIAA